MDMLGSGFQRIKASIIAREHLQSSITSNIANADTPNFRADQRDFAAFFAAQQNNTSRIATTNSKHFSTAPSSSHLGGSIFQSDMSRKMDGNNVDIQTEMARMSENQLMHELSMKLIKGKLTGLLNVIKEGR